MNTEIFDLGKIGITLGGEYDNKVVYEKLTIVLYKGKSYISTKITQGVSPEEDILVWQLVAEAKDAYNMLVDAGKTTLTEKEFLEQLVDATKGRYIVQGNIVNAADEEDLTVEHSDLLGIDTLKLANRPSTDGMGYVILRKNKSFVEQITKENTIYEIRYNFDLNGQQITIPEGCILNFKGGILNNGTLICNFPININAENIQIFKNINLNLHILNPINVCWFGAKGDGVNDDTEAIQKAIDSIKHEYESMGNGCIYIPNPINTYLISDTIILDEHWNIKVYSDTPIYGDRSTKRALITWIGEENNPMISISQYSYNENLENISLNGSNIKGVIGFQIGKKNIQTNGTKYSEYRNLIVFNCDKGLVVGGQTSEVAPDDSFLSFYNCQFYNNKTCGVDVSGGNTGVSFYDLRMGVNGKEPVTETKGCNVYIREGQVNIFGYISGGNSSNYPKDADIYQRYGGLRIYGAWSDTPGVFVYSEHSRWASIISSARHYEGSMTTENTPTSIIWTGPQPLVLEGCSLYNNVELMEGQGGRIIDLGTKFITSGAEIKGPEIAKRPNQLTNINSGIKVGASKLPSEISGSIAEYLKTRHYETHRIATDGIGYISESINSDARIYNLGYNFYTNNICQNKAIVAGGVWKIDARFDSTYDNIVFGLYSGIAENAGDTVSFSKCFAIENNGYVPVLFFYGNKICWSSGSAPSVGTWSIGDICFNSNPAPGRDVLWIHDGTKWTKGPSIPYKTSGTYSEKPSSPAVGTSYFATDKGTAGVGAMIYYTGNSTIPWVYSDGTSVN